MATGRGESINSFSLIVVLLAKGNFCLGIYPGSVEAVVYKLNKEKKERIRSKRLKKNSECRVQI